MIKNEFESRLDEIRAELFEKTKILTHDAAAAAINESGRKTAAKYGISIADEASALSKI